MLAVQGAFAAHREVFRRLGVDTVEVRQVRHLEGIDGLVLPGGESTTMSKLTISLGIFDAIAERLADGMAAFGTCAGAILLSHHIADGRADQRCFSGLDIDVRRNGYGRQIDSFETDLAIRGFEDPFHATFIRAPVIERCGEGVEVLASARDQPVVVRQGRVIATTFHPELGEDDRLHRYFLSVLGE
ncbi:MAG: pyridoxal 5'-phosphate synthase glutaminase subunit PdxT [Microthrixaceae bacterium]|nr:pyridoxal 5'-phosphate synthase glutaminase subunit PdxT [Microthrixaceae bacterium]